MVKNLLTVVAIAMLSLSLTACGRKAEEAPKTAEQLQAERDKTAKTVRENPVYGDQVKAMDKAKAVTDDANKAVDDKLKKAD
jgi:predicted small lipoprotein YifL